MRKIRWIAGVVVMGSVLVHVGPSFAQAAATLPAVQVTADAYRETRGGYLISGDFIVDPRMPTVIFPARPLEEGDVLSVETQHLNDNEYVVLQECAADDCSDARVVRVWTSIAGQPVGGGSDQRIIIPHTNRYWIWAKELPTIGLPDCDTCNTRFVTFARFSPPMTLHPTGEEARYHRAELAKVDEKAALPVTSQTHEGSTFVVTFQGGSTVRIKRMHAAAP